MGVPTLRDVDIEGKRVLLNAELNVPIQDDKIVNDFRIQSALPTMRMILNSGAKQLIIISHLTRGKKEELSHELLVPRLTEVLNEKVAFVDDCLKAPPKDAKVVLLENVRFHDGEKQNDPAFAKKLAAHADVYINDNFGTMHRPYASNIALAACFKEKAIGLITAKEIKNLDFFDPEAPFIALIGAAKLSGKMEVLEALLKKADKVLLGGAIIFPFFKAKGFEIGKSKCEEEFVALAGELLKKYGEKLVFPSDIVISEDLESSEIFTVDVDKIPPVMKGLDIGDKSVEEYKRLLSGAATIFWGGPVGVYEVPPFDTATNELANYMAKLKARTVVGGGDTTAALKKLGVDQYFTHISTGGGAALQVVAGKELPGLKALEK